VVEAKVGKGKLLISAIDISEPRPEQMVLNQFRKSVLDQGDYTREEGASPL
jgi:hypothetical protein